MHSVSTNRPANVPGQWWHLMGDATLDDASLDVALTFNDRCAVDGRDHVNATYYIDAMTNAYHLMANEETLPRGLLYVRLECKFSVETPPGALVRMCVNFSTEGGRWRFTAEFLNGGRRVATVKGTAVARVTGTAAA